MSKPPPRPSGAPPPRAASGKPPPSAPPPPGLKKAPPPKSMKDPNDPRSNRPPQKPRGTAQKAAQPVGVPPKGKPPPRSAPPPNAVPAKPPPEAPAPTQSSDKPPPRGPPPGTGSGKPAPKGAPPGKGSKKPPPKTPPPSVSSGKPPPRGPPPGKGGPAGGKAPPTGAPPPPKGGKAAPPPPDRKKAPPPRGAPPPKTGGQVVAPTGAKRAAPGKKAPPAGKKKPGTPKGASSPKGRAPPPGKPPSGRAPPPGAPPGRAPPPGAPPSAPPSAPAAAAAAAPPVDAPDEEKFAAAELPPAAGEAVAGEDGSAAARPPPSEPPPVQRPPPPGAPPAEGSQLPVGPGPPPPRGAPPPPHGAPLAPPPPRGTPPPPRGAPPPPRGAPPPAPSAPPPVSAPGGPPPPPAGQLPFPEAVPPLIKRGRLNLKCIEGKNVVRKDTKSSGNKLDAYLKILLGEGKKAPKAKTKTIRKAGKHPDFKSEVVSFNLTTPEAMLRDGDLEVRIELWDENAFSDDLLGWVSISVLRFMEHHDRFVEWLPLKMADNSDSDQELCVEFYFEPARVGMLSITCFEGKNLKNMELVGKQDPYITFALGENYKKRTKTIEKGGRNPYFREEEILFWVDETNWASDLHMEVYDEDVGKDDLIGGCLWSVLPFMAKSEFAQQMFEIRNGNESCGQLILLVKFMPAGILAVNCLRGRHLKDTDTFGRQDPYLVFKLGGQAVNQTKKTKVDTDGGTDPVWNERVLFHVVDQYTLEVTCMDKDTMDKDDVIGEVTLSLLPFIKKGHVDQWIPITTTSKWGMKEQTGELHLVMDFWGPPGVYYPQHQEGVDTFDETFRIDINTTDPADGMTQGEMQAAEQKRADDAAAIAASEEFTDKEIEDAFLFLDLDKNMFIGAAEIRHVLVCMGEMITDEEVDEMVHMCDLDGDGQVSYDEFYRMVTDPDPSRPDFGKNLDATPATDGSGAAPLAPGKPKRDQAQMARDLERKKLIKEQLKKFASDNHMSADAINRAHDKHKFSDNKSGKVDFEEWCGIFECEGTGEYRKLFGLYDHEDEDKLDIKEFMLALNNFTNSDKEAKIRFAFKLYDDDHSGFLSEEELVNILKANHMQSEAAVMKKVRTIMAQADDDGDGTINYDEFVVIAHKFPNIMFPNMD